MQELTNFSGYSVDLDRYNGSWDEVSKMIQSFGLSGIELLTGGENDLRTPDNLVKTVHLPGWLGWVRLWREPETIPINCEPLREQYYFGGKQPVDLLENFINNLNHAALLHPAYAVFHVTHIELDEFFTRKHRYTTKEVLATTVSFLNTVSSQFPDGEPPVTIALENLWWPGLTFGSPEEVKYLEDKLEFNNWHYILDTGHMMNMLCVDNEREGIDHILQLLKRLPNSTIERIRSVHLQCSTSGTFQKENFFCEPPVGFNDFPYIDQLSILMPLVAQLDQHRAFTDPKCREIVEFIKPDYIVHEFTSTNRKEFEDKLEIQIGTFHKYT